MNKAGNRPLRPLIAEYNDSVMSFDGTGIDLVLLHAAYDYSYFIYRIVALYVVLLNQPTA